MALKKIGAAGRCRVPPEVRALADLRALHRGAMEEAERKLKCLGWEILEAGAVDISEVADALSTMIDLADAWATSGPEGYTPEERRRRNRAERVLGRLNRHLAKVAAAMGGAS